MCGIWAIFGFAEGVPVNCDCGFSRIKHRGPDAWRLQYDAEIENVVLGFHRLAIVYTPFGMQPMKIYKYPHLSVICNGELYNCKRLGKQHNFVYETGSDVECLLHLFDTFGIEKAVQQLDGVFAFCLVDYKERCFYLGRDPFGVRPLFRLVTNAGAIAISSEAKGLVSLTQQLNGAKWYIEQFKPGHIAKYSMEANNTAKLVYEKRYYEIGSTPRFNLWTPQTSLDGEDVNSSIRMLLSASVEKRLMANRRIGCLLSGGLDSSLISALLVKLCQENQIPYKVQSFAIGMHESPDIKAARIVADHIGTEHHEIIFTEQDVIDALPNVIYQLETADITTIRASIGMYLIAKYIKTHTDTTVIFSGEGADELAQGYIYFRDAPSAEEAHKESNRLLNDIYLYDGLRADRTTAAFSLELRVPFLDLQFTGYYLSLPPEIRQPQNGVEKFLLRSTFSDSNLLPHSILWRHKEAFSDGVAAQKRSMFHIIQDWVDKIVTQDELDNAAIKYPHLTPKTKEAYYYREIFESHYKGQAERLVPYYWMPKWIDVSDPSARFIKHYAAKNDDVAEENSEKNGLI